MNIYNREELRHLQQVLFILPHAHRNREAPEKKEEKEV